MSLFVVDVESDGPAPGLFSMVSFGAIRVDENMWAASDWKNMRKTVHTHHPVDDARGNAEALLAIARLYGLRLSK